jgi:hypothetical protein
MIEVEFTQSTQRVAEECEKYIGPRKFYLHNRIGGEGWDIRPASRYRLATVARFDDPKMATFIKLKLA